MRLLPILATAAGLAAASPVHATAPDGAAFVATFAETCVPQRLSYPGTVAHAKSIGWTETGMSADPELEAVLSAADRETLEMGQEGWTFKRTALSREIGGRGLFLVVTRVHAPDIITLIGCYLYDFAATAPIDPQAASDFAGMPIAREIKDNGLVQFTWGPNLELRPRTLDTNLSFIADNSPHKQTTGFSGLVLKFETSEPDANAADAAVSDKAE